MPTPYPKPMIRRFRPSRFPAFITALPRRKTVLDNATTIA
jgi:hypothetical protein